MTDTPQSMPIEIKRRFTGRVLYSSTTAADLAAAVLEAVAAKVDLSNAKLTDLVMPYGASLDGASLDWASLVGARLDGARLDGASLDGARLVGASLVGASLDGASLDGASLDGARLDEASLDGAQILSVAQVRFTGHGQCGRTLLAVKHEKGIHLWCGCFSGTPDELRAFIANDQERLRKTRTLALDTMLALLDAKNEAAP